MDFQIADAARSVRTVAELTRFHARHRPGKLATRFEERETTYAEIDRRASQIARALAAEGLQKGDRVAYVGKNCDEYFELFFGCAKSGVVVVPVGWRLAVPEILHIVRDAEARLLFVGPELADLVTPLATSLPRVQQIVVMQLAVGSWLRFSEWYGTQSAEDPMLPIEPDEPLLQLYTSGTTGRPKGAQITHRNLIVASFMTREQPEACVKWSADDVSLVTMPVAHISGTGWGYLGFSAGALNVILRDFNPRTVLECVENYSVTRLFVVPAAIQMLLRQPEVREVDFSRLAYIFYGASPIPLELLREAVEVFGCGFCQQYGMTETTGTIVYLPPEDHDANGTPRMRSAGKPFGHVQIRVRRADGALAGPNEVGEIETRSLHNMLGYWNLPESSRDLHTEDGWLRTGDAGYLDEDGYLFIHDRMKDLIITGAENVYPTEVENAIHGCPGVAEVAVIGVPDERWGEAVKAMVVPLPGRQLDADEIIRYAKARIASFKAPKSIDFLKSLPRNASGKLLRRELREPYWAARVRQVN